MKRFLLPENGNFYKANLHCHTVYSDGKMTPEEIKELYKSNGYSVVAFTDHEFIMDHSELNDESFLAITACELAIKEFKGVSTSENRDMKVCHLNFYAKDARNTDTPCYSSDYDKYSKKHNITVVNTQGEYERVYSGEGVSDMIRIGNESGFLVCYNHPTWSLENATDYLNYKGLWAFEIYNTSCVRMGLDEYNPGMYDDFLRSGERIACVAADDNHGLKSSLGGHVMIKAAGLDYKSIMNALENHDFYASTGPRITELYLEDNVAHLSFSGGEYAVMSTHGRRVEKKFATDPNGENKVEFTVLPESDGYLRFTVKDKNGNFANTSAYFL